MKYITEFLRLIVGIFEDIANIFISDGYPIAKEAEIDAYSSVLIHSSLLNQGKYSLNIHFC